MTMQNLLAVLFLTVAASPAAAPAPTGLFEIHAESPPGSTAAKAWTMTRQGGAIETVSLDPAVILDVSGVATADVEHGPDGSAQIRLGLTAGGAQRLAEAVSRYRGRRLGVVVAGKLRAAPYVTGSPTGRVFVIAGLSDADAKEIVRSLGPPAPTPVPAPAVAASPGRRAVAIPEVQGRWRVVEASMNGRPIPDPKLTASLWFFRGAELILTNGEGRSQTFSVIAEGPGALSIGPVTPSSERGGWILWKRDKEDLLLAFQDNLEERPDGWQPGPKKILARLRAPGPR
ncbi:MAG: hypothetical protein ABI592_13620 [Acidobacteriota bacterium]